MKTNIETQETILFLYACKYLIYVLLNLIHFMRVINPRVHFKYYPFLTQKNKWLFKNNIVMF